MIRDLWSLLVQTSINKVLWNNKCNALLLYVAFVQTCILSEFSLHSLQYNSFKTLRREKLLTVGSCWLLVTWHFYLLVEFGIITYLSYYFWRTTSYVSTYFRLTQLSLHTLLTDSRLISQWNKKKTCRVSQDQIMCLHYIMYLLNPLWLP